MKYDAFISYRHSELDMFIAKKVHKGLETFKVPGAVAKKCGKKKIKRVFRDQEELPIGSDLNDNISGALAQSEWLLVICSPRTPESYWVRKEIQSFIGMHDRDHVLAILIEGEPDESFPEDLLIDEEGNPVEPLAADVRGKNKGEINKKFKTEIMRLAAPILGCNYDDLRQRHRERRLKKITAIVAAAGTIVAALGVAFGLYNANMVKQIEAKSKIIEEKSAVIEAKSKEVEENYEGKQINQSKYLADTSTKLLKDGDRRAAILVALEALPSEESPRPYVAEAELALTNALYTYNIGNVMSMDKVLHHELPVNKMEYSDDGKYLTTVTSNNSVYVWDVETGKVIINLPTAYAKSGYIVSVFYASVMNEKLFVCGGDKITAYSLDGKEVWSCDLPAYSNYCKADITRGRMFVIGNKEVAVYDTEKLKETTRFVSEEIPFGSTYAFSENGKYFAVNHYSLDRKGGLVSVFNLETGKMTDYATPHNSVSELTIDNTGALYTLSYENEDFIYGYDENGNLPSVVEKYEGGSATPVWSYQKTIMTNTSATFYIRMRGVEDGENGYSVAFSCNEDLTYLCGKDGSVISEASFTDPITTLLVNSNEYAFVNNGQKVEIVDLHTGYVYTNNSIDTGIGISEFGLRNSYLAIRNYANPDIRIMTYHSGEGMKEIATFDSGITRMFSSTNESYYIVVNGYGSADTQYHIFDASTDEEIVQLKTFMESTVFAQFIDDKTFLYIDMDGSIILYDCESRKDISRIQNDYSSVKASISNNNKYVVMTGYEMLLVYDIAAGTFKEVDCSEYSLVNAEVSDDGNTVYAYDRTGLKILDANTGAETMSLPAVYDYPLEIASKHCVNLSHNGKYIAVSCKDSTVRVYDTDAKTTICEIPLATTTRNYVQFSGDDKLIYLQGDDFYFRIYDIEKKDFVMISREQYNEFFSVRESLDGKTVSLSNYYEMVVVNLETLTIKNSVSKVSLYMANQNKIYVGGGTSLKSFPISSLEELIAKAQALYGDKPLTDVERLKYNID